MMRYGVRSDNASGRTLTRFFGVRGSMPNTADVSEEQLRLIWRATGLPKTGLDQVRLDVGAPTLPTSYQVAAMASAAIAAAGAASAEIWRLRSGESQDVTVNSRHAEAEFKSSTYLGIDGKHDSRLWGPIAGVYRCQDGRWVRVHANYPAHEQGVLDILGCAPRPDAVAAELARWRAQDFEDACGARGLVVFMMRSEDEWSRHGQGAALSQLPLFDIEKIGDAPVEPFPGLPASGGQPLSGLGVLDLTRVIAGPVAGRTLALHGADVLRISAAHLPPDAPELEIDGGRGKVSRFIDLVEPDGRQRLEDLIRHGDVFMQGYRPGAIAAKGFSDERVAELRPGIVTVSISAWGHVGPWRQRRGFDSLVQTASGINHGEAATAGIVDRPKELPCQALDY